MKLALLDPCEAFRIGLAAALSRTRFRPEVVLNADRADVDSIGAVAPDVVLADLRIQPGDAVGLLARLRELDFPFRVGVMSRHAPAAVVRHVLAAGACGFLLTTVPVVQLVEAIERMMDGDTVIPAASPTSDGDRTAPAMQAERVSTLDSLSRRERQVSTSSSGLNRRIWVVQDLHRPQAVHPGRRRLERPADRRFGPGQCVPPWLVP